MQDRIKWWQISLMLAVVGLLAIGVAIFWEGVRANQVVANRLKCQSQLKLISLAMHDYHKVHGHFPPAHVLGPDGKPWHSWRVLLLGYTPEDALYRDYNFNEPWDGPNNSKLQARMPKFFACPSDPDNLKKGRTNYFAVVGPDTAFPGAKPTKFDDITRSRADTILLVEAVGQDINWMEPRDLSFDNMSFHFDDPSIPSVSSKHRAANVVMVDGTIWNVHGKSPLEVRTMFLIRDPAK